MEEAWVRRWDSAPGREVARGDHCMQVLGCSATICASKRPFCRTGNGHVGRDRTLWL